MAHTLSSALFTATEDYLLTIDPSNPPTPDVIEEGLLEETKRVFTLENSIRAKGDKLKIQVRLDVWQIA